jgi:hypothetical protein
MIKFPQLHIAESVLNRVFNTLEGDLQSFNPPMEAPNVPDPTAEGVQIEQQAAVPPAPASAPEGLEQETQDGAMASSLTGGSPLDGALMGALGQ